MRIPLVRSGTDTTPIARWEYLFTPFIIIYMMWLCVWTLPSFWLYPENLLQPAEVNGTDEDLAQLEAYRAYRKRIGAFRRVLEKLHVVSFDAGPTGRLA